MASRRQNGFSLLEMMIVISISLVLAAVTTMSLQPVWKQQHVDDAYNTTLTSLRRARDQAVADMRIYAVTFPAANPGVNGGTITVQQDAGGVLSATPLFTATLPPDVTYNVTPGVPVSNTAAPTTPDSFGTASAGPFDFDQVTGGGGNIIYFYPDGSAQDADPNGGNPNNGVVYLSIPGNLNTCRAVSLWGYTGRIRGWQLVSLSGAWTWVQK